MVPRNSKKRRKRGNEMSSDHLERRQTYSDTRRQRCYDARDREREITYEETLGSLPGRGYTNDISSVYSTANDAVRITVCGSTSSRGENIFVDTVPGMYRPQGPARPADRKNALIRY